MEKLVSISFPFSLQLQETIKRQLASETLKQQQGPLCITVTSGVDELEKELQQFTTQFNNQYTDYVKQLTGNSLNDQINEWQDKWKRTFCSCATANCFSTTKASLSILTQNKRSI
ncbi:hypothetical protein AAHB49_14245 [Bacillus cereus]